MSDTYREKPSLRIIDPRISYALQVQKWHAMSVEFVTETDITSGVK
jgi:hypothetical protein